MRKFLIASLMFSLIVFGCFFANSIGGQLTHDPPQVTELQESAQRRGCCSWHGGVCGCDQATGRVICCDGTLSPTCT